jgi:hypothetical protein
MQASAKRLTDLAVRVDGLGIAIADTVISACLQSAPELGRSVR